MKYLFFALVLVILFSGCDPFPALKIEYRIEITGSSEAHIMLNRIDYGFEMLPFNQHMIYDSKLNSFNSIKIEVWSISDINIDIYKDNILIISETDTYFEKIIMTEN